MSDKQKYQPVQARTVRDLPLSQSSDIPPKRIKQVPRGTQETPPMESVHIPVVNPVSAGDKSLAGKKRVYEKGRKNRSRT